MASNTDKRIIALTRTMWGLGEVRAYLTCSKTRAYKEIALCRLRFGYANGNEKKVKRDDFLEMQGTDFKTEMANAYLEKEIEQHAKEKREKEIFPSRLQNQS